MQKNKLDKKENNIYSTKKKNLILGIDPGSTVIGYGVIEYESTNRKPRAIDYGYIDLKQYCRQEEKLLHLSKDLKEIFKEYKPKYMAIENIFFFKNAKTFTAVSEAKGVILLTAAEAQVDIHEYTPLQVKQSISGYGKADKKIIEKLIQNSLDICTRITPDDSSDALAIALCHYHHLINV